MRAAAWITVASIASAIAAAVVAGWRATAPEVLLGMFGPLTAVTVSWVLTERIYAREPARLTGVLIGAFGAKMVFFGGYVAVMLMAAGMRPGPFVASFTSYFIALYLTEALLMRRLFEQSGGSRT
jgi:hypothetical protein